MTRFSDRYAIALIVLGLAAGVASMYLRATGERDECTSDAALLDKDGIYPGMYLIEEGPRSTNLANRRLTGYVAGGGEDERPAMLFTVMRSFGLPNGLVQPAAALPGELEPDSVESTTVDVDGVTIPVNFAYEKLTDSVRSTGYFMAYRGEPIASPFWTRVRTAPLALIDGRWPITLFVISTRVHPAFVHRANEEMGLWMASAWRHYARVCSP